MLEKAVTLNKAENSLWLVSFANMHLEAEVISFYSWYQNNSINPQTNVHCSALINIPRTL